MKQNKQKCKHQNCKHKFISVGEPYTGLEVCVKCKHKYLNVVKPPIVQESWEEKIDNWVEQYVKGPEGIVCLSSLIKTEMRQEIAKAKDNGITEGMNLVKATYEANKEVWEAKARQGERERIKEIIEDTPIDKAHTYSGGCVATFRQIVSDITYDRGQENYKEKILTLINNQII